MEPIVIHCSACGGANAVNMNTLPLSGVSEPTSYEADCALCGETFSFGYIPNSREPDAAVVEAKVPPARLTASGGGAATRPNRGPSPNDQRSNTLNSNNPASRATASNRANQMNPNNPSFRASRGRRG